MNNKPNTRFKGFNGLWKLQTLEKICANFKSGTGITSTEISELGGYPVYGGNGLRGYTNTYTHNGEYILIGRQGALCGNINTFSGKAYISEHAIAIGENNLSYIWFLEQLLLKLNLNSYSESTAQPGLSVDKLKKISVYVPAKEEQVVIGNFLRILDNNINLNIFKLKLLRQLKKAYLQQMFPQSGESTPRVRFAGFKEPWEIRKLGDITNSYSGGTPNIKKKELYGGEIPFIRSAEINADKTQLFLSKEGLENSSAKMIEVGTILYALYGATSGEVGLSKISGAINQAILAIKPIRGYDANFIAQWLRRQKSNIVSTYLQGGQGNLSAAIVKELTVLTPSKEEQAAIGHFFHTLDTQISTHQTKLSTLKQLKAAYLQNMLA